MTLCVTHELYLMRSSGKYNKFILFRQQFQYRFFKATCSFKHKTFLVLSILLSLRHAYIYTIYIHTLEYIQQVEVVTYFIKKIKKYSTLQTILYF